MVVRYEPSASNLQAISAERIRRSKEHQQASWGRIQATRRTILGTRERIAGLKRKQRVA